MNNISKFHKEFDRTLSVILLAALTVSVTVLVSTPAALAASSETPQYMFEQIAEDLKVDAAAKTFRLVNANQQTLYFSDRPVRVAGHIKMADYLKEWTAKAGKDNFGQDPPNAVLSVYESGQSSNTTAPAPRASWYPTN